MSALNDLLQRATDLRAGLQSGEIIRLAVLPYGDEVVDLQREQLAEGKAASGEDLRPYYSEDLKPGGYFHSTATAANYAAWKQSINNPYEAGQRNPDAPNLYINGKFYSEIGVSFGADRAIIVPLSTFAMWIIAKYGEGAFGLTMERWTRLLTGVAYRNLMDEVRRKIGLN